MAGPLLFAGGGLIARELRRNEIPLLQAFYDANPEYFLTINGVPPPPDLAAIEFDEVPPPHLSFERQWRLGLFEPLPAERAMGHDSDGRLAGIVMVTSDLGLRGVWHLGLFVIATRLHGTGAAAGACGALEGWVRECGARYLRLGVVQGNARAERFWARQGYRELRQRAGVDTGGRINTVRVMLKPLADEGIEAYLRAAPRDQPGSPLP
jgi:GNAT superfamily N-acetyltransferase